MKKKTKIENIFLLTMLLLGCFGVFCITGCGGKKCETIKFGTVDEPEVSGCGISLPGCGGCLTSGKGCDLPIWVQSNKISCATVGDEFAVDEKNFERYATKKHKIISLDRRYYGGGCLGCGQIEKSCYAGCYLSKDFKGCFNGSSENSTKWTGCGNGCSFCRKGKYYEDPEIGFIESREGIE